MKACRQRRQLAAPLARRAVHEPRRAVGAGLERQPRRLRALRAEVALPVVGAGPPVQRDELTIPARAAELAADRAWRAGLAAAGVDDGAADLRAEAVEERDGGARDHRGRVEVEALSRRLAAAELAGPRRPIGPLDPIVLEPAKSPWLVARVGLAGPRAHCDEVEDASATFRAEHAPNEYDGVGFNSMPHDDLGIQDRRAVHDEQRRWRAGDRSVPQTGQIQGTGRVRLLVLSGLHVEVAEKGGDGEQLRKMCAPHTHTLLLSWKKKRQRQGCSGCGMSHRSWYAFSDRLRDQKVRLRLLPSSPGSPGPCGIPR